VNNAMYVYMCVDVGMCVRVDVRMTGYMSVYMSVLYTHVCTYSLSVVCCVYYDIFLIGVMRTCPVEYHSITDMRHVFDTNVFGSVYLTQLAIPLLKESKGRIINMTSVTAIAGMSTLQCL
jgi:NAD(P)-dependent dehydrogenase (short-subunit alcohol dehydrogenase family)